MSSSNISVRLCFAILPIIAKTNLPNMTAKCTFLLRFDVISGEFGLAMVFRYQFGLRYQVSDLVSQDIRISVDTASDWLIWAR